MKKIEFTHPQQVIDYLVNTALPAALNVAEFQKEVIFNTAQETVDESDEPEELDPDNFDYVNAAYGKVGEYMEEVIIVYQGKELSLNDPNGINYMAGVEFSWLYGCFEYDEKEATNKEGWKMSEAIKNYAWGYLAAMENYID